MSPKSRALGLWTLVALVIGNMIGAGVFTTAGFALGALGSPFQVLAAWLIGGLLALCGALSYGALARLMPESAGEYLYLSRIIHPGVGFVAGWISLLAGFTAAIAYAALTFAAYAMPGADTSLAPDLLATAVIVVAVLLHALRVRHGATVQNIAVALKLLLIVGFCLFATLGAGVSSWQGLAEVRDHAWQAPPFAVAPFAQTLMWISFSYAGFNAAVYLAGEVPAARTRVPSALIVGTALTMLAYLWLNAVFLLAPPIAHVAHREDVAAVAAVAVGGEAMADAVRFLIALALLTSVSAMVMAGPRVYARMAEDGLFPQALRLRGEAPTAAVVMQGVLAIIVVWIAGIRELLSYLGFTLGLSSAVTVAALFVAIRREPDRGAALPGYPWAPMIFVLSTLTFAALAATVNPWEMVAALATVASGALLYWLVRKRR